MAIGSYVNMDDVVAVIETDKVSVEVRAQAAGTLVEFSCEMDDVVEVGADFAEVDTDAKAGAAPTPAAEAPKATPVESAPTPAPVKQVSNCPKAI